VRLRLLTLVVVAGLALLAWRTFRAQLPAAERGRRLAETTGCFGCHGAEGTHGTANPGRLDRSVPTFRSDVMMYAKTRAEIREWITQGSTARRRGSRTWREQRELGTLRMPGFGRRLSAAAIDDLVAFVEAQSMTSDSLADSLVRRGFDRADQLGCDGCHGPGGRFARRNPGSLKGYIPSWDGRPPRQRKLGCDRLAPALARCASLALLLPLGLLCALAPQAVLEGRHRSPSRVLWNGAPDAGDRGTRRTARPMRRAKLAEPAAARKRAQAACPPS